MNFKLWFVFCGPHEIKGGLLIIESSCGRHIELDDMVVYGGLIFVDDPSQKRSSALAQRFEITSYLVDEMTKKYERIELSLSPCCDDLRPFQWYRWGEDSGRFDFRLRYTSMLDISGLIGCDSGLGGLVFQGLDLGKKKNIRSALKRNLKTKVNEKPDFASKRLVECYARNLKIQNIDVDPFKLQQIQNCLLSMVRKDLGCIVEIENSDGELLYSLAFLSDSKRAYALFGSPGLSGMDPDAGTFAHWQGFNYLAKMKGVREVDLEGINSPGIGRFKLGFGGSISQYFEVQRS